jgi:ribosomal protein S18 acetylase RimI-like enzyme
VPIEIRPVSGMEQLERWVAVRNEVFPDDPENVGMMALVRAQEPDHVNLLAYLDGEPAGTAMLADDPESQSSGRPWVEVNVPVRHRGRGVGTALFAAVAVHARDRGATGLACEVRADDAYSRAFLERRGFREYGRFEQCALELTADSLPDPVTPDGIKLTWLGDEPSLLQGMHAVAVVTYPELLSHRARQAESFLDWQVYELGSPNTLLDAVPVAVAGDEAVGFATMRRLLDNTVGEIRTVVVLPEWRRQGVASALIGGLLERARAGGMSRVVVWVRHSWPIELFRRLGFEVADGAILLQGPLR